MSKGFSRREVHGVCVLHYIREKNRREVKSQLPAAEQPGQGRQAQGWGSRLPGFPLHLHPFWLSTSGRLRDILHPCEDAMGMQTLGSWCIYNNCYFYSTFWISVSYSVVTHHRLILNGNKIKSVKSSFHQTIFMWCILTYSVLHDLIKEKKNKKTSNCQWPSLQNIFLIDF